MTVSERAEPEGGSEEGRLVTPLFVLITTAGLAYFLAIG